ncbi:MAG: VOC family protein [Candidatus Euphemobacter frigidus]|nr:VOC family protein [Candidatus Euphemobacter frigidus]
MIDHVCIEVSSKERCREVFEEVLGLKLAYSFKIDKEFMERMFEIHGSCEAVVYQAGDSKIEVFIRPEMEKAGRKTSHLCLLLPDRERVLKAAEEKGLVVLHHPRDGRPLCYIRDHDENLYEIKGLD